MLDAVCHPLKACPGRCKTSLGPHNSINVCCSRHICCIACSSCHDLALCSRMVLAALCIIPCLCSIARHKHQRWLLTCSILFHTIKVVSEVAPCYYQLGMHQNQQNFRCAQTCVRLSSKQCWRVQAHQQPEAGPKGPWSSNASPPATTGRVPGLPQAPLTQTNLNTPPPLASSSTSPAPSSASTTTGDNPPHHSV